MKTLNLAVLAGSLALVCTVSAPVKAWESFADVKIAKVEIDTMTGDFTIYANGPICKGSAPDVAEQAIFPTAAPEAVKNRVLSVVLAAYLAGRNVRVFTTKVDAQCRIEAISPL